MRKKFFTTSVTILICIFLAAVLAGCGGGNNQQGEDGELRGMLQINGSSTVTPVAQAWAEKIDTQYPDVEVAVTGSGSGNGIVALINGTTDIAMSSRDMKEEEHSKLENPQEHVIARDALAVIVHPDNPVESLTMQELKGIFTGEIKNWKEIGGPDEKINVYARDTSSGTYVYFRDEVLDGEEYANNARLTSSNSNLAQSVSQEETSIGYVGLAFVDESVKAVPIIPKGEEEPVKPTMENAKSGEYPIARDLLMYTDGEPGPLAEEYLSYGMSEEGQSIVEEVGYVPVK